MKSAQTFHEAFADLPGLLQCAIVQEQAEFVAAEARERIAFAHAVEQQRGDLAQQLVARKMPDSVVDDLEAVEIEKTKRVLPTVFFAAGESLIETAFEFAPVDEAGQGGVLGVIGHFLAGATLLSDVTEYDDHAQRFAVTAADVRGFAFNRILLATAIHQQDAAVVGVNGDIALQAGGDGVGDRTAGFLVQHLEDVGKQQSTRLLLRPSQQFFRDRIQRLHAAGGISGDETVADGAQRNLEPFLFYKQQLFGARALGDFTSKFGGAFGHPPLELIMRLEQGGFDAGLGGNVLVLEYHLDHFAPIHDGIDISTHPASRPCDAGSSLRVIIYGGNGQRFSCETTQHIGQDALFGELRIGKDVVCARHFRRCAPQALPSPVDRNGPAIGRENLNAEGRVLEQGVRTASLAGVHAGRSGLIRGRGRYDFGHAGRRAYRLDSITDQAAALVQNADHGYGAVCQHRGEAAQPFGCNRAVSQTATIRHFHSPTIWTERYTSPPGKQVANRYRPRVVFVHRSHPWVGSRVFLCAPNDRRFYISGNPPQEKKRHREYDGACLRLLVRNQVRIRPCLAIDHLTAMVATTATPTVKRISTSDDMGM